MGLACNDSDIKSKRILSQGPKTIEGHDPALIFSQAHHEQ